MTDATRQVIVEAFENFNKWETYDTVFALMTQRRCTLREIQEIAAEVAHIPPEVIAMRRGDILGMSGGLEPHRRYVRNMKQMEGES